MKKLFILLPFLLLFFPSSAFASGTFHIDSITIDPNLDPAFNSNHITITSSNFSPNTTDCVGMNFISVGIFQPDTCTPALFIDSKDFVFNNVVEQPGSFEFYDHNFNSWLSQTITLHSGQYSYDFPTIGAITVSPNPVQINSPITASANFTDPDTTSTHTASWDWGDRSTPTNGTVTETNGSGSVSDSHTYTTAGVYTITLTVGQETAQYQYVSVYNPTAQGLFSAGQKYTSPAGAYAANTSLTGNVKFGLSYKYQGTVPTGVRQFSMDFNQANFHFNATAVNALVISNGIGTLTGTGTVNGAGTYSFLVTGSESANTIRIQIKDSSGNVIYDTQPGASDTATPTTSVTGNVLAH